MTCDLGASVCQGGAEADWSRTPCPSSTVSPDLGDADKGKTPPWDYVGFDEIRLAKRAKVSADGRLFSKYCSRPDWFLQAVESVHSKKTMTWTDMLIRELGPWLPMLRDSGLGLPLKSIEKPSDKLHDGEDGWTLLYAEFGHFTSGRSMCRRSAWITDRDLLGLGIRCCVFVESRIITQGRLLGDCGIELNIEWSNELGYHVNKMDSCNIVYLPTWSGPSGTRHGAMACSICPEEPTWTWCRGKLTA